MVPARWRVDGGRRGGGIIGRAAEPRAGAAERSEDVARLRGGGLDEQLAAALSCALAMSVEREFDLVILTEPEGGYSVLVPELPSVATQGETIEEARANAREAIEGYLEVMHEDGLPIPSVHRERVAVQAA